MNTDRPAPPRAALWLLRHVFGGTDGNALTGDLLERYATEGRSRGWFWRQTASALAAGIPSAAWRPMTDLTRRLPWWDLPWPASQFLFEAAPGVILPLAALFGLVAGLRIRGRFHWSSLAKSGLLSLLFTAAAVYLRLGIIGPPRQGAHSPLVLPLFTLLAAAWTGCSSGRRARATAQ